MNTHQPPKTTRLDNIPSQWDKNNHIPPEKMRRGSVKGKVAVRLDDRTIVFIDPAKDPDKVRERYMKHIRSFHWVDTSGNMNRPNEKKQQTDATRLDK